MASFPTVHVQVHSVAGELLEFDVKSRSLVGGLKQNVEDSWQVPSECQKLVCGTTVLKDSESVVSNLPSNSRILCVTMIKTMDMVYQRLADKGMRPEERIGLMRKIAQVAPKADEDALKALCLCLGDSSSEVRRVAIEAMISMDGVGNEFLINNLCNCLKSPKDTMRLAAIEGLPKIAGKGNDRVIAAFIRHLIDESPSVRRLALTTLPQTAHLDDERIVSVVIDEITEIDTGVPYSAETVLPQCVSKGNQSAISAMLGLLQDKAVHYFIRQRAVHVICEVARPDDEKAVAAILEACECTDDRIMLTALVKLPKLVTPGNYRAIRVLERIEREGVEEHSSVVLRAAGKSLAQIALSPEIVD